MRPGGFSFKAAAAGDGPGEAGGRAGFSRSWGCLGWSRMELRAMIVTLRSLAVIVHESGLEWN